MRFISEILPEESKVLSNVSQTESQRHECRVTYIQLFKCVNLSPYDINAIKTRTLGQQTISGDSRRFPVLGNLSTFFDLLFLQTVEK